MKDEIEKVKNRADKMIENKKNCYTKLMNLN